jgi:hypothetical protein
MRFKVRDPDSSILLKHSHLKDVLPRCLGVLVFIVIR